MIFYSMISKIIQTLVILSSFFASGLGLNLNSGFSYVNYWGQNSYGATHPADSPNWERDLAIYCLDNSSSADIFVLGFLDIFNVGGTPGLNFANHCSDTFPGTSLLHCPTIAQDIKTCQANGKKILLSLGGSA